APPGAGGARRRPARRAGRRPRSGRRRRRRSRSDRSAGVRATPAPPAGVRRGNPSAAGAARAGSRAPEGSGSYPYGLLSGSTGAVGPLVRRQAEAVAGRVARAFEHDALTYGTYNDEVNRLAHCLRHAGVRRGEPVAILCPNSPLFLASIGAVAKLGAIGALINTHVRGAGLTAVCRASGATVGICDAEALPFLAAVQDPPPVRFLAAAAADAALPRAARPLERPARADEPDIPDVRGGDVFLYIYTPGTTGYPKPAIVRHLRFTMAGIGLAPLLGLEEGETIYAPLPLYHGE